MSKRVMLLAGCLAWVVIVCAPEPSWAQALLISSSRALRGASADALGFEPSGSWARPVPTRPTGPGPVGPIGPTGPTGPGNPPPSTITRPLFPTFWPSVFGGRPIPTLGRPGLPISQR